MSSGDETQQGGGQAEPQNGVPTAVPPSFGASTASQPIAPAPPAPANPVVVTTTAAPPEPEPTVGWYASTPAIGPYAVSGGKSGAKGSRTQGWGSRPTWGSNRSSRSKLVNATLFGVAPLALAGIVAAAFVLASPGKGQASSHAGFLAGAGPSAPQQPQGNGSTSTTQPSPTNSRTRPGKRSTMPDGKPRPSQQASSNQGSGHHPGSTPKSQPAKKKKPSSTSGGPVIPANLGVPNFDGYCGHIGRGSAVTTVNTSYGWACSTNPSLPMSIQNACGYTYGLPLSKIINVSTNYNDPNAWQCWRTNGIAGQLNIVSYCTAAGLGAAKLSPANAYGWTCAGTPIDTNAACQLMYHNGNAFSRFAVFQDPYSWQCWA